MGRGTIDSEIGQGQYTITLDYGSAELQSEIDQLTARIAEYTNTIIPEYESTVSDREAVLASALFSLNSAIDAWGTAGFPEDGAELAAVNTATAEATAAKRAVESGERVLAKANLEKNNLELKKANLEQYDLTSTGDAWCVDYTTGAEGVVATIEVPGEPVTTLIAPGAEAHTAADGYVTGRAVQKSYQSYWNVAALPGWQKWKPTYRFGFIDTIDRPNNTCQVTLYDAESTATGGTGQPLNINQASTLFDVPFEYMSCNHAAFSAGDDVVVKFENQDWEQPKVIGFKTNPKSCSSIVGRWLQEYTTTGPDPDYEIWHFAIRGKVKFTDPDDGNTGYDLLTALRSVPELPAPHLPSNMFVEFRAEGDPAWTQMQVTGYSLTGLTSDVIGWFWGAEDGGGNSLANFVLIDSTDEVRNFPPDTPTDVISLYQTVPVIGYFIIDDPTNTYPDRNTKVYEVRARDSNNEVFFHIAFDFPTKALQNVIEFDYTDNDILETFYSDTSGEWIVLEGYNFGD